MVPCCSFILNDLEFEMSHAANYCPGFCVSELLSLPCNLVPLIVSTVPLIVSTDVTNCLGACKEVAYLFCIALSLK